MRYYAKNLFLMVSLMAFINPSSFAQNVPQDSFAATPTIQIILASTRQGRSSEKIGKNIEKIAKQKGITVEIVDLRDYQLPFLDDAVAPMQRKEITDPSVKKWSEKISSAYAFIIVCPEYNGGYTGVLKNALDSLFVEWNNKQVGFVVYSGGPSGGTNVLSQLEQVIQRLKMIPVATSIKIPTTWKAFDKNDDFVDASIIHDCGMMLEQLATTQK